MPHYGITAPPRRYRTHHRPPKLEQSIYRTYGHHHARIDANRIDAMRIALTRCDAMRCEPRHPSPRSHTSTDEKARGRKTHECYTLECSAAFYRVSNRARAPLSVVPVVPPWPPNDEHAALCR